MHVLQQMTILGAIVALSSLQIGGAKGAKVTQPSKRDSAQLPELFDFERYRRLFDKHYSTGLEETARKKVFMARAMRVFVSSIEYKKRLSSSFKSLNHLSDRFEFEMKQMENKVLTGMLKLDHQVSGQPEPSDTDDDDDQMLSLDLEEFERNLHQLSDPSGDIESDLLRDKSVATSLAIRLIRDELHRTSRASKPAEKTRSRSSASRGPRHKRHASEERLLSKLSPSRERQLPSAKLINVGHRPLISAAAAKKVDLTPSGNNPDYEEPEPAMFEWSHGVLDELKWWDIGNISSSSTSLRGSESGAEARPLLARATSELASRVELAMVEADTSNEKPAESELAPDDMPDDEVFFDHRDSGCMLAPRDQGSRCGCCYAFAAISIMEWLYCKHTGKLTKFSEQYLIDCGKLAGSDGCEGGTWEEVGNFVQNFGLELQHKYRYVGRENVCPYAEALDQKSIEPKHMGFIRMQLDHGNKISIEHWADYIRYSPMFVAVDLDDGFHEYGNGVYKMDRCGDERHAMVLIGHGREAGQEYWLLRNSYGVNWGDKGYFKLSKSTDCFYPKYATIYGEIDDDSDRLSYRGAPNELNDGQIVRNKYKKRTK